jgi:hypothetical protein
VFKPLSFVAGYYEGSPDPSHGQPPEDSVQHRLTADLEESLGELLGERAQP